MDAGVARPRAAAFDVEGEGLTAEFALADWPSPDADVAIAAEGALRGCGVDVAPFDATVAAGEGMVLHGGTAANRAALMLALGGRVAVTAGRLKVDGLVVPARASTVRARTAYVRIEQGSTSPGAIEDAIASGARILFIDAADGIAATSAGIGIRSLLTAARDADTITIVAAGDDPERARYLLPIDMVVSTVNLRPVAVERAMARGTDVRAPSAFSATVGSRHLGWLATAGLLAVPLIVGGILTWALATPTAHLDRVSAAIVNDDEPVTVNGQTVPLGRQFAAGLIAGTDDSDPASASAAADGAASADATTESTPAPSNFDWVLTNDDEASAGLNAGRYAAVITIPATFSAAATSIGGPAAAAHQAVIEVETTPSSAFLDPALTEAVTAAATASLNQQLISQYLGDVYAGFNTINEQIGEAADGAASLSSGAMSVADGAQQLAVGTDQLVDGLAALDSGADALGAGTAELDAAAQTLPGEAADLARGSAAIATIVDPAVAALDGATDGFAATVAQVCQTPGAVCDRATAALTRLQDADARVDEIATLADRVATGNAELADAMVPFVAAIDESAAGAGDVAAGADQAMSGAESLSTGAGSLADGAAQVDSGASQLADGLSSAVEQIPTYSDDDITTLSSVVSQPVLADQSAIAPGFQSVPLFTIVALWFGGLVIALARRAVPTRMLLTAASSGAIVGRSVRWTAALGAGQGLVVAVTLLFGVTIGPLEWLGFTGASVVIGAVFALVNQGLAAAFGAVGRLGALLIGLVALTAGLTSTVPPVIESIAGALPTTPAYDLLLASLTGDGAAVAPALGWLALAAAVGVGLVYVGVATRRRVSPREIADTTDAV